MASISGTVILGSVYLRVDALSALGAEHATRLADGEGIARAARGQQFNLVRMGDAHRFPDGPGDILG
jgi:hypothetical protein